MQLAQLDDETRLRKLLQQNSGSVKLPEGVFTLHAGLVVAGSARGLVIEGTGTTLRAAADFKGRALLEIPGGDGITVRNLTFEGNRSAVNQPRGLPPDDTLFATFYSQNGLLVERASHVHLNSLKFREIADMAVLVSRSRDVSVDDITVEDSGSLNRARRNNATGGIVFEEGCSDFQVSHSHFSRIRGNALWTHSWHRSPRNARGRFEENRFDTIGRDAIQVGHATQIVVAKNTGRKIGFPIDDVDAEGGGIPVAIDTGGNVDQSSYMDNEFNEIDGKCIDLDGFHNGEVLRNRCRNASPESFPFGQFGIVFNNTNPLMRSESVQVRANVIDGLKFGAVFVIGRDNVIEGNTFSRLNLAHCGEKSGGACSYFPNDPDLMRSGIYFGKGGERPDPASNTTVRGNVITGYGMASHCIGFATGVSHQQKTIAENRCSDR